MGPIIVKRKIIGSILAAQLGVENRDDFLKTAIDEIKSVTTEEEMQKEQNGFQSW